MASVQSVFLGDSGREFRVDSLAAQNALSPNLVCVLGTV